MPFNQKAALDSRAGFRPIKRITTDGTYTQLGIEDHIVHCITATGHHDVHLPDVAEANGMLYCIKITTDGGFNVLVKTSYGLETPVQVGSTIIGTDGYLWALSNGEDWGVVYGAGGS